MTIDFEVLSVDCALSQGVIRVREDLAVEVKNDRVAIQRGEVAVEVFPGEDRHLASALAEAAVTLVDRRAREGQHSCQHEAAGERAALVFRPVRERLIFAIIPRTKTKEVYDAW